MQAVSEADFETAALFSALERCTLESLSHDDHVRVAWYLLTRSDLAATLAVLPGILQRYASSKGHPEYYHETITFAFTCLIHERIGSTDNRGWNAFAAANPDLFDRDLLNRYYPQELLRSDRARRTFVFPPTPSRETA